MQHFKSIFSLTFWFGYLGEHAVGGSLALLGLSLLTKKLCGLIGSLYHHFLRPTRNLEERYGTGWVIIVTDASDPIGAEYARKLGKRFCVMILCNEGHAVEQDLMDAIEKRGNHAVFKAVNFRDGYGSESFKYIREFFSDKQVCMIIVNNLGVRAVEEHASTTEYFQEAVMFPLLLQRCLLPSMLKRDKKSAIITLSRLNLTSSPQGVLELATKAFMRAYSRSLSAEYKGKIDALHIETGSLIGEEKLKGIHSMMKLAPNEVVKAQLRHVGYEKEGCGHWKHEVERDYGSVPHNI